MSELQTRFIDDTYAEYYNTGKHELAQVYLKSEADKAIADLEESHKMEVEQLLMEIVELKEQVHDYGQGLYVMQTRAEKEACHHKFKRCLNKAEMCESKVYHIRRTPLCDMSKHEYWQYENDFWQRWHKRWLEIAEQFKEAK